MQAALARGGSRNAPEDRIFLSARGSIARLSVEGSRTCFGGIQPVQHRRTGRMSSAPRGSAEGIFVRPPRHAIYWLEAGVLAERLSRTRNGDRTATRTSSRWNQMLRRRNAPEIVPLPWASAEALLEDSYLCRLAGCAAVVRIHIGTRRREPRPITPQVTIGYT